MTSTSFNEDDYYTSSDLCKRYKITSRTLARWRNMYADFPQGKSVLGRGMTKFFPKSEIHAWEAELPMGA